MDNRVNLSADRGVFVFSGYVDDVDWHPQYTRNKCMDLSHQMEPWMLTHPSLTLIGIKFCEDEISLSVGQKIDLRLEVVGPFFGHVHIEGVVRSGSPCVRVDVDKVNLVSVDAESASVDSIEIGEQITLEEAFALPETIGVENERG